MERTLAAPETAEITWIAADLAPGDAAVREPAPGTRVRRIRSAEDPWFLPAYERLWREFGRKREMEAREVIASRFAWDPSRPNGDYRYLYEVLVVERGGETIAVRDHTAIAAETSPGETEVWVHLSHVLVEQPWRGTGMAAWLRALPLQTARECAAALGRAPAAITLVAEMEAPARGDAAALRPLASYGRAGFQQIDPSQTRYCQPDFRSAAEIDASGVEPVPLRLVIRRVGREHERQIPGREVRAIVRTLYEMFAVHVRKSHMAPLWTIHDALPDPDATVDLVIPAAWSPAADAPRRGANR
jgi:GNAT superfamily N-acetyltransferase